jgi:hypothetical protein
MPINKGQVLIVTLFILTSSMIVTFMLLVPVVSQSLKVRALLNGFQALANAERGIEIGNYYALKGNNLVSGTGCPGCVIISHSDSHCDEFTTGPFVECRGETIGDNLNFQSHIDVALSQIAPIEIKSSRNISQGVYRGVSRILQFIFTPRQD